MKLTAHDRLLTKKSVIKQIRREGNIPAVLYSNQHTNLAVTISGEEMGAVLRYMKPGHLGTTVFELSLNGQTRRVIIKDIQYHLTTYKVTHLDFEELFDDVAVSFKVPIECTGVADCSGVKMGGFLRQIIRHVKVQSLPCHMPSHLEIDVRDLGIKQSKKLSDIIMPEGVTPLAKMNEVVVVVSKRSN
ncbi:MAG: 50S ribosomal protein L25/general stress protein Ctc [Candidatus Rhabdochlamydia sp.]